MINSIKQCLIVALTFLIASTGFSQNQKESNFNKYKAFSPMFMEKEVNSYHSATGMPGENYWQNRANYEISATLDTAKKRLNGQETITYINNSPYKLHFLWLQLDQNTFKKSARSTALYPDNDRNGVKHHTNGYIIHSVEINGEKADFIINDTRMQIRLKEPVKADGKKVKIHITYSFDIPFHGKDRMGRVKTKNGWIYTFAQWYPRMAVFDEVKGWNTLPYLGTGEFYLEYGDFEYSVTVPDNMIVAGSGVLQNPKDVLTKKERNQLEKAWKSDSTITILSKKEMEEGTHHVEGKDGTLTWHFKMENSRDVAWTASSAFIWDAARINLPNDKTALAQSVYPVENSGMNGYGRSTEYTKHCIELYSKKWTPYTYKVATNVGAHELGMEYPGIVFCSYKSRNGQLWGVINHEFGHNWFPMLVGSNERIFGWMDEGLNTFLNSISTKQFNNGEYYEPKDFQSMGARIFNEDLDPIYTRADVIHNQSNLGIEAYYKPSTALSVLRNVVLGKDRFDYAFKTYIKRWKYKHPQPWDFFNTMSNAAGEDLGWFFKGWFMHNWKNDQGVKSINYVDSVPKNGAVIALENYGKIPMPVELLITYKDQTQDSVKLPVEIWMTGPIYKYHLPSKKKINSVVIDPHHLVPDTNPVNNTLYKLEGAPKGVTGKSVLAHYIKEIGGRDKLDSIRNITIKRTTTFKGLSLNFVNKFKKPDKYKRSIKILGYPVLKYVINGDDVTLYQRGEKVDMDAEKKEKLIQKTHPIFPEKNYLNGNYTIQLLGVLNKKNRQQYVVKVTDSTGKDTKLFYNTKTGLKEKAINVSSGKLKRYKKYEKHDGILFPEKISSDMLGKESWLRLKEVKINTDMKDSEFQ